MTPRIGSLCTGYGGLDIAVQAVFGGTTAWVSDVDPGANQILAHHWPTTPNIGDLTTTNWAAIEPVDIVCGGYPCQPFSSAGLRKGTDDERHIWPYIATALGVLRPRLAVFENVSGHLRLGFDAVLADLARIRFHAEWVCVEAQGVGAPHKRRRLILLAWPADAEGTGLAWEGIRGRSAERGAASAHAADLGHERGGDTRGRRLGPADDCVPATNAHRGGLAGHSELPPGRDALRQRERHDAHGRHPAAAADTDSLGRRAGEYLLRPGQPDVEGRTVADTAGVGPGEGRPEPAGQQGGSGPASGGVPDWGRFAPAIRRWEHVLGRRAPWATDDRNRLSPAFVEWLMGLPAGHVTDVPDLPRTAQLKALGNGVVPQQAEAALRLLLARLEPEAEVA